MRFTNESWGISSYAPGIMVSICLDFIMNGYLAM